MYVIRNKLIIIIIKNCCSLLINGINSVVSKFKKKNAKQRGKWFIYYYHLEKSRVDDKIYNNLSNLTQKTKTCSSFKEHSAKKFVELRTEFFKSEQENHFKYLKKNFKTVIKIFKKMTGEKKPKKNDNWKKN